jgi:hypothetical protein
MSAASDFFDGNNRDACPCPECLGMAATLEDGWAFVPLAPEKASGMIKSFHETLPEQGLKTQTQYDISALLDRIESLLIEKNRKYGDSALSPVRVFSKVDPVEQLKVRIDDKLSRISSGQSDEDEDVIIDLIGYLVLYMIALERKA